MTEITRRSDEPPQCHLSMELRALGELGLPINDGEDTNLRAPPHDVEDTV